MVDTRQQDEDGDPIGEPSPGLSEADERALAVLDNGRTGQWALAHLRARLAAGSPSQHLSTSVEDSTQAKPCVTREIESVIAERKKQDDKWGAQNHGPDGWLAILMEEVGEVAKAVLEGSGLKYDDELVQVSAVAVAALECLHRGNLEMGSLVKAQKELKRLREIGVNVRTARRSPR